MSGRPNVTSTRPGIPRLKQVFPKEKLTEGDRANEQNHDHRQGSLCSPWAFPHPCWTPIAAEIPQEELGTPAKTLSPQNPIQSRMCLGLGRSRVSLTAGTRGSSPNSVLPGAARSPPFARRREATTSRCLAGGSFKRLRPPPPQRLCRARSCRLLRAPKSQGGQEKERGLFLSPLSCPTPGKKRRRGKPHQERGPSKPWHDPAGGRASWIGAGWGGGCCNKMVQGIKSTRRERNKVWNPRPPAFSADPADGAGVTRLPRGGHLPWK